MRIEEIMTREVITVNATDPVEKCAALLLENNISGLPVLDDIGALAGMITEGDLIRRASRIKAPGYLEILGGLVYLGNPQRFVDELLRAMSLTAGELMTPRVITVKPGATVEEAATLMSKKQVNRLPVVDMADNLVGIVSRRDIMRAIYENNGE